MMSDLTIYSITFLTIFQKDVRINQCLLRYKLSSFQHGTRNTEHGTRNDELVRFTSA